MKTDLIDRADALALATTKESQLFDAALYMEIENLETVEAIPVDYIRNKARNAIGAESTYLRKLLKEWENES